MNNTIFAIIVFVGILGLLTASFYGTQYSLATSNINSTTLSGNATFQNTTIIGGSTSSPPTCTSNGGIFAGIPVISGITDFFGCFSSLVIWLYQFVFINSDVPYLKVILLGASAVMVWGIARLLKPVGGT